MKTFALAVLLLCTGASAEVEGHPISKVIDLLKGLKEKAIEEGKQEEVAYGKFTYWCSTSISELEGAIADEKELISELEDKIAAGEKKEAKLEKEIGELEEIIGDLEKDQKKADGIRKDTADLYSTTLSDIQGTIKAVEECIKALEGAESTTESLLAAKKKISQVVSLLSVKATETQIATLQRFSQPDVKAAGDEAAHVDKYDFKSENVIELLKQLLLKFEDDETQATKEETNSINAYDLATDARDNEIAAAEKSKDVKSKSLAKTKKTLADDRGSLKDTNDELDADTKTLKVTEDACAKKKGEWETRSKTRELEVEAIEAAIGILAKVTGVRTEAPGNPIPPASPTDFLQLSASPKDAKQKAVAVLKEAASKYHSQALLRLAVSVSSHLTGPGAFDQVINMIEKMIFRLMDEQKQEDEHKHWCDQELKKTDTMIEDKEDKIQELKDEIDVQKGKVALLQKEIKSADDMIADIIAFMAEATEIRNIGKQENKEAIADSEDAQKALANAIAVLTEFYKESGAVAKEAWEFIQSPGVKLPANPETWGSSYTGVADPKSASTGIITILEKTMEDFSIMEADTRAQEKQDQESYEEVMSENDIEKAKRTQETKMKNEEMERRNDKIASLSSTKKDTEGELEKTEQYLSDLQPACVEGDSTYEDRKAAREKEEQALRKAQDILTDAFKGKSFLQKKASRQMTLSL